MAKIGHHSKGPKINYRNSKSNFKDVMVLTAIKPICGNCTNNNKYPTQENHLNN